MKDAINQAVGQDFFLDPAIDVPPRGRKLYLLTKTGCTVIGMWIEGNYIGWRPLYRPTPAMLQKIESIDATHTA